MTPDCIVFVISQPYLSARREAALTTALAEAAPLPARIVRLEGLGTTLRQAMSALACEGFRRLLIQPFGLPFPESLVAWLPGVASHWLENEAPAGVEIAVGPDAIEDGEAVRTFAARLVGAADPLAPIAAKPSLGKRGWDHVPPFSQHLLVCTGPRCHYREAPWLRRALEAKLAGTEIASQVHITQTGCLFPCNRGPIVAHYPAGRWYRIEDDAQLSRFVATVLIEGGAARELEIFALDRGGPRPPASGEQGASA